MINNIKRKKICIALPAYDVRVYVKYDKALDPVCQN